MNLSLLLLPLVVQTSPQTIPKAELPKRASCIVCIAKGSDHGEERVVGGVRYRGSAYFFCNPKEAEEFAADPDGFLPLPIPRPMPAFDLTDDRGNRWNQATFKGRTILVDFWATWCAPCHKLKPALDRVRAKYLGQGVELLSVSIDDKPGDLERFLKRNPFPNPVLLDDAQTWVAWRVKTIPAVFLVSNGQIVGSWVGKVEEAVVARAVEEAVRARQSGSREGGSRGPLGLRNPLRPHAS